MLQRHIALLETEERLETDERTLVVGRAGLAALSAVRDLIEEIVTVDLAALDALPWTRDWVFTLAYDARDVRGGTFDDGTLPALIEGWSRGVREVTVDTNDLGSWPVTVDYVPSREEQRDLLLKAIAALEAEMRARAEVLLDQIHPVGTRPYSIKQERQIQRDVDLWVRVNVDREPIDEIAADAADRADYEPEFRVRQGGRRSSIPKTSRGVHEAVKRADSLLSSDAPSV